MNAPMIVVRVRRGMTEALLPSPSDACPAGYALVLDPNSLTILTYHALRKGYEVLKTDPWYGLGREAVLSARAEVQELVGLEDLYRIEAETTEKETLARLSQR